MASKGKKITMTQEEETRLIDALSAKMKADFDPKFAQMTVIATTLGEGLRKHADQITELSKNLHSVSESVSELSKKRTTTSRDDDNVTIGVCIGRMIVSGFCGSVVGAVPVALMGLTGGPVLLGASIGAFAFALSSAAADASLVSKKDEKKETTKAEVDLHIKTSPSVT